MLGQQDTFVNDEGIYVGILNLNNLISQKPNERASCAGWFSWLKIIMTLLRDLNTILELSAYKLQVMFLFSKVKENISSTYC